MVLSQSITKKAAVFSVVTYMLGSPLCAVASSHPVAQGKSPQQSKDKSEGNDNKSTTDQTEVITRDASFKYDFVTSSLSYYSYKGSVVTNARPFLDRHTQIVVEIIGAPAGSKIEAKFSPSRGDGPALETKSQVPVRVAPTLSKISLTVAQEAILKSHAPEVYDQVLAVNLQVGILLKRSKIEDFRLAQGKLVNCLIKINDLTRTSRAKVGKMSLVESAALLEVFNLLDKQIESIASFAKDFPFEVEKQKATQLYVSIPDVSTDGKLIVIVTPPGADAVAKTASMAVAVARPGGIVPDFSAAIQVIPNPRRKFVVRNGAIQAERDDLFVLPAFTAGFRFVFDDELADGYRFLNKLLTLGMFDKRRHRIGFSLGAQVGTSDSPSSASIGVNWYFTRDLDWSLNYGLIYRQEEEILGSYHVGSAVNENVPFSRSRLRYSFYFGVSYSPKT